MTRPKLTNQLNDEPENKEPQIGLRKSPSDILRGAIAAGVAATLYSSPANGEDHNWEIAPSYNWHVAEPGTHGGSLHVSRHWGVFEWNVFDAALTYAIPKQQLDLHVGMQVGFSLPLGDIAELHLCAGMAVGVTPNPDPNPVDVGLILTSDAGVCFNLTDSFGICGGVAPHYDLNTKESEYPIVLGFSFAR